MPRAITVNVQEVLGHHRGTAVDGFGGAVEDPTCKEIAAGPLLHAAAREAVPWLRRRVSILLPGPLCRCRQHRDGQQCFPDGSALLLGFPSKPHHGLGQWLPPEYTPWLWGNPGNGEHPWVPQNIPAAWGAPEGTRVPVLGVCR